MPFSIAWQTGISQLHSEDANFGTGKGWTEYFIPFSEEVHESFHHKYNLHRPPKWRRILRNTIKTKSPSFIFWKLKFLLKALVRHCIDCPQDILPDCLTLNTDERATISRRFVIRLTLLKLNSYHTIPFEGISKGISKATSFANLYVLLFMKLLVYSLHV